VACFGADEVVPAVVRCCKRVVLCGLDGAQMPQIDCNAEEEQGEASKAR